MKNTTNKVAQNAKAKKCVFKVILFSTPVKIYSLQEGYTVKKLKGPK